MPKLHLFEGPKTLSGHKLGQRDVQSLLLDAPPHDKDILSRGTLNLVSSVKGNLIEG